MKKLSLVICLFVILTCNSFADQNSNGSVVWVNNFEGMASFAANNVDFTQKETGYNYSCGMFSLDLVLSYHEIYNNGVPFYTRYDIFNPEIPKNRIYYYYILMGQGFNTITKIKDIKSLVRYDIPNFYAVTAYGSNPTMTNLSDMKNKLKQNYPVIIALEANFSGNPVYGYQHIVVIFKYDANQKLIYFFDPYYGEVGTIDSSNSNTINNAVVGNLPYLRIYPE